MKRLITLWFIIGSSYYVLEGIWRGSSNIVMLFIGGLCGMFVGLINEHPVFCKLKIYQQSIIGVLITLFIEFITGWVLNIQLGLGIWDYSNLKFNLMGQISLLYGLLWFMVMPLVIWFDDWLRFKLYAEKEPKRLKEIYYEFVMLK